MAATSTAEALQYLDRRADVPAVIISDMARREGLTYQRSAGLDLIREVRARRVTTPILIYTSSALEKYRPMVEQAGGNGITASPMELYRLVERTTAART